eukprot:8753619-Prorocentrum_lima.AAC.1
MAASRGMFTISHAPLVTVISACSPAPRISTVAPAGRAVMSRSPGSATPLHTRRWPSSAMLRVASLGSSCSA